MTGTPEGAALERELKLAVDRLGPVAEELRRCGGEESTERHWERNWVLDRNRELIGVGALLRVRELLRPDGTCAGAVLTTKTLPEPSRQLAAARRGVKERIEHEVEVASAGASLALLSALGYEAQRRYDKVRCCWMLAGHEVALDETPIGSFVEIEGKQPERIARRLGLPERGDLRNYLALYDDERSRRGDLPFDMVFPEGPPAGFVAPAAGTGPEDHA